MTQRESVYVVVYMRSGFGDPNRVAVFVDESEANLFSLRIKRELGITPSVIHAVVNHTFKSSKTGD